MRHPALPWLLVGLLFQPMKARPIPEGPWPYPPARGGEVVDDYFGTKVADPYRWLENLDSPETRAWVRSENALTFGFLAKLPERAFFRRRLTELWNYARYGLPFKEGGRYFFSRNTGLQNQPVLCVQDGLRQPARVLFDPNLLAADGTVALTDAAVSHDGRWLAYGTAAAGSDWNEIRVRDVGSGKDTGDLLRWIKFSGPSWTEDNRGFFYSRYPAPADSGTGETFARLAHQRIYYHRLGSPQGEDRLIYETPGEPAWFVGADATEDGRYAVVTTSRGDSENNLLAVIDLKDPRNPDCGGPLLPLVETWNAEYSVIGNDGPLLYVQTNLGAPRRRLIAIDLRRPKGPWPTLVPEGPDTIESSALIGGRLVVLEMRDASSRIRLYAKDGRPLGEIPLPGLGTVAGLSGHERDPELFYNFTSFIQPTTVFRHDLDSGENELFRAPSLTFDPSAYETRQDFYRSKDGTRVPIFLTARKNPEPGRPAPALLYGYGGFDIPITPSFTPTTIAWLELGGVYAVANLRGGGEYGKAWHDAGTREKKQNVFDDFIAAADWLVARGITTPSQLVISGASNGGLLIGATLNQRPDLCRVAWPAVGVMDMLRFQKFTIGYAWVSDYGSSDSPEGFRVLRAYSPLHNIRAGVRYPAILVTTADHDDRVFPAHSFKYTAAMQASVYNGPDALPVMIRIETRAGHGAGKPISKQIDEAADKFAFAAHFLKLRTER